MTWASMTAANSSSFEPKCDRRHAGRRVAAFEERAGRDLHDRAAPLELVLLAFADVTFHTVLVSTLFR
jgi:hypothetical protein